MKSSSQVSRRASNTFWARLSLQAKTLSIFLFVTLVPVIGLTVYGTLQTQQALTSAAELSLKGNAAQAAASLDAFIDTSLDGVRVEAQSPDLVEYLSLPVSARQNTPVEERLLTYLNVLDGKDAINIFSYGILDSNGINVLDNNNAHVGESEADGVYFQQVMQQGVPYASAVIQRSEGSPVIYFASPIRNAERVIIGVLRAEYNASVLQQIANASAEIGTSTTVIVLDENFVRQADTSNSDRVLQPIVDNTALVSALDVNTSGQFLEVDLFLDVDGTDALATARMDSQPWIVIVSQPRTLLLGAVQERTTANLLILLGVAVAVSILALVTSRNLIGPLAALTRTAETISSGDLAARAEIQSQDEIGQLAGSFNYMADQLNQILAGLEQRVQERTVALTKRSTQLEAVANVARSVATVQEFDSLLAEITTLVSERFGFYHVGIFLLDTNREYANLRAANSTGGKRMLVRGHRLRVGEQGIVGFVTQRGIPRIALDVGTEAVFFNNPDLPETHSEVALPLQISNTVIGALDIQSMEVNAFSQEDVEIFSILADQVSVAIQNARLLDQSQRALHEADVATSQLTGEAWRQYGERMDIIGYRYDGIKPEVIRLRGMEEEKNSLSLPVQLRGQVIGRLKLKTADPHRQWTEDERAMLEATAERVAIALESARLLDDAQRRATRESFLSEIGAKLGTSFQMDSIMRDTVEELGKNLTGSTVSFQLVSPSTPSERNSGKNSE